MSVHGARQKINDIVMSWPGVSADTHRFGGTEFRLGTRKLGHIHGDHLVDLPFPKKVRDEIVAAGRAQPHHVLPRSGWVSFYLNEPADIDRAVALLRQSFDLAGQNSLARRTELVSPQKNRGIDWRHNYESNHCRCPSNLAGDCPGVASFGAFVSPLGTIPLRIVIAVAAPLIVFFAVYSMSAALRTFVLEIDVALATALQAWRFGGFTFLALYAHGVLPGIFSWPAGLGDMAIGVTAPWVAFALGRQSDFVTSRLFVVWNLLGILDLVVAVSIGAVQRASPQAQRVRSPLHQWHKCRSC